MRLDVAAIPLRIGARTLVHLPRRLVRRALTLDEALAGTVPDLPRLVAADGYWLMSVPDGAALPGGYAARVRQRYPRWYVDLTIGYDAYRRGLSAATRSGLARKARRLAAASGGAIDIRRYHHAGDWATFHALARPVSARTYQERLIDAGLPAAPAEVRELLRLAGEDRLRAWLLFVAGEPVAYLCCTATGDTLRYDHVGFDPRHAALSPGAVLLAEALRELFEERRFVRFDFTEGDGRHKRQLATGSVACMDVLLLRPTFANRLALAVSAGWDAAVAAAKRGAGTRLAARVATWVRR